MGIGSSKEPSRGGSLFRKRARFGGGVSLGLLPVLDGKYAVVGTNSGKDSGESFCPEL